MWAAGALRGSPASTTITDRRWRPSWSAAASPAADPPMTATSQCRSTVRGAWSLMASTIRSIPISARVLAIFARTRGGAMAELERDRTGGSHPAAKPSAHAGPVARRARRTHQPQSLHDQPGRDRQADDQPRHPAAAGSGPPGRPRRAPRRAQRRRCGHPPGAEQLGQAHDLDAEPTDRQHDRRQDATRTDPHGRRAAGPPRSRLVLRHRGAGAPVARRTRDHRRDRRGRRVRHHDAARLRSHRRPGRAHHDLRPRRPTRPRPSRNPMAIRRRSPRHTRRRPLTSRRPRRHGRSAAPQ